MNCEHGDCVDLHHARNSALGGAIFSTIHALTISFLFCITNREGKRVYLFVVCFLEITIAICVFIAVETFYAFVKSASSFEITIQSTTGEQVYAFELDWHMGYSWIIMLVTGLVAVTSSIISMYLVKNIPNIQEGTVTERDSKFYASGRDPVNSSSFSGPLLANEIHH